MTKRVRPILRHGLSRTPEYRAWQTMRHRCLEPTSPAYEDYGGRGITIADEWINDPAAFVAHVGLRPSPAHEIDRKDNDRGYVPGNVRWVTRTVNSRNRRSSRMIDFRGETRTLSSWCAEFGLPTDTVRCRIKNGWSLDEVFTTPVRPISPSGTQKIRDKEVAARKKRGRERDVHGRFIFDGDAGRLCMCGHALADHAVDAPQPCNADRGNCTCNGFGMKRVRQFKVADPVARHIPQRD